MNQHLDLERINRRNGTVIASVSDIIVFSLSFLISGFIIGFLLWLVYLKGTRHHLSTATSVLPAVNALLNGLSACFLFAGYAAVRKRRISVHTRFMIAALTSSTIFLITYVIYHNAHGDTPFRGVGFIRLIYLFILSSHVLLTTVALPLILITFFIALTGRFEVHKKVARITLPTWLYVSVTGVVIFFVLKTFS